MHSATEARPILFDDIVRIERTAGEIFVVTKDGETHRIYIGTRDYYEVIVASQHRAITSVVAGEGDAPGTIQIALTVDRSLAPASAVVERLRSSEREWRQIAVQVVYRS
jgi:hypothetical protein